MSSTFSQQPGGGGVGAIGGLYGMQIVEPSSWLQDLIIATNFLSPALALLFVIIRVVIRAQMNTFGWDDRFIVLAMTLSIAMGVGSYFVTKGLFLGIHFYDVPASPDLTNGLIWVFFNGLIYNVILAFVKQSVLAFILRIAGLNPRVRLVCWLTSIFNLSEMIAVFLVVIFQCKPIASFWNPELGQDCINQQDFAISTALLTIVTDVVVVALPFYVFLGLQMSKKKKAALIVVFSMGLIVTIVSILRLWTLLVMFDKASNPDFNFSFGPAIPAIECNLAIITACVPTLWPLVRRFKQLGSLPSTSSSYCPHCHHDKGHSSHWKSSSSRQSSRWTSRSSQRKPLMRDELMVTRTFTIDTPTTATLAGPSLTAGFEADMARVEGAASSASNADAAMGAMRDAHSSESALVVGEGGGETSSVPGRPSMSEVDGGVVVPVPVQAELRRTKSLGMKMERSMGAIHEAEEAHLHEDVRGQREPECLV